MQVKICGIRTLHNLEELESTAVDYIGFIFYHKSKRNFVAGDVTREAMGQVSQKKVGVFVDETVEQILATAKEYGLDVIQLHGAESQADCLAVQQAGYVVWKAFPVYDTLPANLESYMDSVDAFLFDTKGADHGGNGVKFDWSVLNQYTLEKPFVLSGGIGREDAAAIKNIKHPQLLAVDVNSRFEIEPGLKNAELLNEFIMEIKNQEEI
ncbi:phosphoribosylanthranilate isomerase [Reichenbachiella agarivorans]|uniref:N-(5'-phosphoribosyl)anthranilate isomerase n=1 Tax=Reichenbachiella agarivorans TaxID=2979464 RepID=A0ABY6CMW2_9BACT|nr:phosphoribosylanthranilate isomerase [Reichenbachiella agarivorans]UXP31851.1 phosphoribosylanthranilate isomerase [Reichenbachiella agarivorans]